MIYSFHVLNTPLLRSRTKPSFAEMSTWSRSSHAKGAFPGLLPVAIARLKVSSPPFLLLQRIASSSTTTSRYFWRWNLKPTKHRATFRACVRSNKPVIIWAEMGKYQEKAGSQWRTVVEVRIRHRNITEILGNLGDYSRKRSFSFTLSRIWTDLEILKAMISDGCGKTDRDRDTEAKSGPSAPDLKSATRELLHWKLARRWSWEKVIRTTTHFAVRYALI